MKEENKFKMVFGKTLAQRDFFNLQNQSKLLKPASLNKLLRKREWKLEPIPEALNKDLQFNPTKRKKRKGVRRRDFSEELTSNEFSAEEINQISNTNLLYPEEKIGESQIKHDQFNKQVHIGRLDMQEFPNSENMWDYLAYNLRKELNFFIFNV